jgi:hypothetical protein
MTSVVLANVYGKSDTAVVNTNPGKSGAIA